MSALQNLCAHGLGGATNFEFRISDHESRISNFESRKSSLRVPRVMPLHALWQQSFPSALAPAGERGAAAFGFHACAKTVLVFARAFGRLVSAFHKVRIAISPRT